MKYMILTYASQKDYDAMTGKPGVQSPWMPQDFAAMGAFMEAFNRELAESGELVETCGLTAPAHARRQQSHAVAQEVRTGALLRLVEQVQQCHPETRWPSLWSSMWCLITLLGSTRWAFCQRPSGLHHDLRRY
jgi:hypothetical protein